VSLCVARGALQQQQYLLDQNQGQWQCKQVVVPWRGIVIVTTLKMMGSYEKVNKHEV